MNRIDQLFQNRKRNILNIFLTAGFPGKNDLVSLVQQLDSNGVDVVEIGMPYSDPLADGLTIQQASTQALQNGMTLDLLFDQLRQLRPTVKLPIILMGYFNQVMQYGEETFVNACKECGVDGLILPDLPLVEYERKYQKLFSEAGIKTALLVCPGTSEERIRKIDELTTGFIYVVADAATTGNAKGISESQKAYFQRIRDLDLRNPLMIGFGISDAASFNTACGYAEGAIIGSAFLRAIADKKEDGLKRAVAEFLESVLEGTREGSYQG